MPELIDVSGKTILITDDNPVNVQLIKSILEKNGYRTASADNGKACIDMAAQINPDLILLDIVMPETSGIEVCRVLTENQPTQSIPVIFVTADTDNSTLKEAFEAGGTDYVCKPINNIELLARIKSVLIQRELTKQLMQDEKLQGILETAGAVCHELNQPLQYLSGCSELILMNLSDDHPVHKDISKMKLQIEKMGEITKKLMGITSCETRSYAGNNRILDINRSSESLF